MDRLLLIDASSFLFRAYHALPDLRSRQNHPTGALTGMVNMLRRVQQDFPASHHACVFDPRGGSFRDQIYPAYKANRGAMPEDLEAQIQPIFAMVRALGWPLVVVDGLEADDVIGTLVAQASARGLPSLIATGDKDMAQLVNEQVQLVDTMSRDGAAVRPTGVEQVLEKFGVRPDQIIDFLTLTGDAVDNVPGVETVGPKTAAKWLGQYQTLDALMAQAHEVGGVVGENLRKALDWLPTGRRLVTIVTDADLSPALADLTELQLRPPNLEALTQLRDEFDLGRTLRGLVADVTTAPRTGSHTQAGHAAGVAGGGEPIGAVSLGAGSVSASGEPPMRALPPVPQTHYQTITTAQDLKALLAQIEAAEIVAFDTETDSLDARHAHLVGLSFCWALGQAAYIPIGHRYAGAPDQLPSDQVLAVLKPWFENPDRPKLAQNMKYDVHVMAHAGVRVQGMAHDTLLQSYVLEAHRPHTLESLALRHLGRQGLSYDEVTGKGAGRISFDQVSVDVASRYSCEDSDFTFQLHTVLWPQIQSDPQLSFVYEQIEMPTMRCLIALEDNGILIDPALLEAQTQELSLAITQHEAQAHELAGGPFNLGSPKQLGEILFDRLGYPPVKKTAKGAPSTDEDVLETLAQDYPLPKVLLAWRSLSKLKSTYTEKLPRMVDPDTGRIHSTFSQAVAVTGRLASSEPNLQNIPIRTAEGRRIRQAFIAPPGQVLVSADYSQIELRIMAHLSDDPGLVSAFLNGEDVHRATASEIFGLPREAVSDEQRRYAKVINFGLIYGMSAFGLAQNLGIERSAAAAYIERYFDRYPGVLQYMERTKQFAHTHGYVETIFGRRLWLPDINGGSGPRRAGAERAAINAPMQGTAADLIKLAMSQLQDQLSRSGLNARMLLQVHDELIFEVTEADQAPLQALVRSVMENVHALKVPLLVSVGVGLNWDDAH